MAHANLQLNAWIAASGRGDAAAFGHLSRALSGQLWGLALRYCAGNHANAEDVLQEVLVKLWTQSPRWQNHDNVAALASTMVHHVAMDGHRKARRTTHEVPEVATPETVTGTVWAKQRRDALEAAMATLPLRQQQAVKLAYFGEQPTRTVANALGVSEGATEALLVRARRTLGKLLPRNLMGEL